jgi:hypothetical protein
MASCFIRTANSFSNKKGRNRPSSPYRGGWPYQPPRFYLAGRCQLILVYFFHAITIITAQGCIADAHSLPEITEKMVVRGGVRPHAQPFFRDFIGTLRCNTISFQHKGDGKLYILQIAQIL